VRILVIIELLHLSPGRSKRASFSSLVFSWKHHQYLTPQPSSGAQQRKVEVESTRYNDLVSNNIISVM